MTSASHAAREDAALTPNAADTPARPIETLVPAHGPDAWTVQVASFQDEVKARSLVDRLKRAGVEMLAPLSVEIGGATWFRVQAAPTDDRQEAAALLPRIRQIAGLQGMLIRYRPEHEY